MRRLLGSPAVRRAVRLVAPEGLVFAGVAGLLSWETAVAALRPLLSLLPFLVLAAVLLLAARLRSGRLLLGLLALVLADRALVHLGAPPGADGVARQLVGVLLPAVLVVVSLLPERGIASRAGAIRAGALLLLAGAALLAGVHAAGLLRPLLAATFLPAAASRWTPLGDPALVAFAGGVGLLVVRLLLRPDPVARGLLWATVAALPALGAGPPVPGPTTWFAAAGLLLAVAGVEASVSMAYRDELTGLPSRRALEAALLRLGRRFTVAMVDVDRFKRINDRYGHDVGDQVLRMVASRLRRASGGGRPFRYGGEEFALLFPGRDLEEARPHLEGIREGVAKKPFVVRGPDRPPAKPRSGRSSGGGKRELSVTVSVGAADSRGGAVSPREAIEAADAALYRAKEAGRDRLVTA